MNRQILNTTTLGIAAMLMLVAAVSSAQAQGSATLRADIPFDFTVSGKTLPAGTYTVRQASSNDLATLSITSIEGKGGAFFHSILLDDRTGQSQAKLVFHRYDDRYFLSEVWSPVDEGAFGVPESREERLLEKVMTAHASPAKTTQNSLQRATVNVVASLR